MTSSYFIKNKYFGKVIFPMLLIMKRLIYQVSRLFSLASIILSLLPLSKWPV